MRNKTFFSLAFFWIYVSNSFRQKLDKCVGLKNNPAQRKTVTGREDASFSVPDMLRPAQRPVRCWDVGGCIASYSAISLTRKASRNSVPPPGKLENSKAFCGRVFHGCSTARKVRTYKLALCFPSILALCFRSIIANKRELRYDVRQ